MEQMCVRFRAYLLVTRDVVLEILAVEAILPGRVDKRRKQRMSRERL